MLRSDETENDLIILGGGINGAGIAKAASQKGYTVTLLEAEDFASGTSSASTKLIHGGLRYLEQFDFNLVRKSLIERDKLLSDYPTLVSPMQFTVPQLHSIRPLWFIRLGLFLYDYLYWQNSLPKSGLYQFSQDQDLKAHIKQGFHYSDCWVDDSRLVIETLSEAQSFGASIKNYSKATETEYHDSKWKLIYFDKLNKRHETIYGKCIINASGPWLDINQQELLHTDKTSLSLVKGSHLIIKNHLQMNRNYLLQNQDKRVIFVIPYLQHYLLVGTTDEQFDGNLDHFSPSKNEINYLLDVYNGYFSRSISHHDIVHVYSGVRPLLDENKAAQSISRDYRLIWQKDRSLWLNILGGKLTTFRKLAEDALKEINSQLTPSGQPKICNTPEIVSPDSKLEKELFNRYGGRFQKVLAYQKPNSQVFGSLQSFEVEYFINEEYAKTADDIIWRRSKAGFDLSIEDYQNLQQFITNYQYK